MELPESFWVHGKISIKVSVPNPVSRSDHMRASQPVDGMFMHVYQWLVKGVLHTTSTTTMCDSDHSKTTSRLTDTENFLWLFMKKDNVLQIQCNDNIMYYNTVEECMSVITAYWVICLIYNV